MERRETTIVTHQRRLQQQDLKAKIRKRIKNRASRQLSNKTTPTKCWMLRGISLQLSSLPLQQRRHHHRRHLNVNFHVEISIMSK